VARCRRPLPDEQHFEAFPAWSKQPMVKVKSATVDERPRQIGVPLNPGD